MLPFKIDLTGKTVVITGGGGVLCSEFAYSLAECGANIALLDIKQENAQGVADKIGDCAIAVQADVLSRESLEAARAIVADKFGTCDILINGAGGNSPKCTITEEYLAAEDIDKQEGMTFFDVLPENLRFVFDINFTGAFLTTQVFAKDMALKSPGDFCVINISSMNAFTPLTKIPAYSAAKSAVSNFTQWLAVYFSRVGIRVNAIAPGFFVSDQNRALLFNPDGTPTKRANKILAATPMGRFGEPNELIGALLWLCSSAGSGFVNGVVVPVDGGFSAYSGV